MTLEYQILAAFALDLIAGDPRWLPHPVRLMGGLALSLEAPLRRMLRNPRIAGIAVVCIVVGLTGLVAFFLIDLAALLYPWIADAVSILLLYTSFATRDLMKHSYRVYRALADNDIVEARKRVCMLVGRDTDALDETGVVRAAVESVAENIVDGITAPIFFAALFGPVGALAYKAASTLDSTFGYKDERYLLFGWASARLDDLLNYIPSRLTAPLMALAAAFIGLHPRNSARIFLRDGRKHASPNSGLSEAAMAGALGVQLGGLNYYGGEPHDGPKLGDPFRPLDKRDIVTANMLVLETSIFCLLLFTGVRAALQSL